MVSAERISSKTSQAASPLRMASAEPHRAQGPLPATSNQIMQRKMIQAKLTVNQPGDRFEQEADRVADSVMRMADPAMGPPPQIQRMCSHCQKEMAMPTIQRMCSHCQEEMETPTVQRMCSECEKEIHRKESASAPSSPGGIQVPRGAGRPLPDSVRGFFEPRFGRDFSHVRIHTGSQADESARSLNALAYTSGPDIVFANGYYSTDTAQGRKLLAHELTHVIQQGSRRARHTIQRACRGSVPRTPGCEPDPSITPPSTRFLFNVNCDDFAPSTDPRFTTEEARLADVASHFAPGTTVQVIGLASFDGPTDLNHRLACSRAQIGAAVIRRSAPAGVTISSVDATVGGPSTANDRNMRAVGLNISAPPPRPRHPHPPPPVIKPGPRTPCERDCVFDFQRCLNLSSNPLECLARRSSCLRGCVGAPTAFEVCARLLQPPVEISGCNHTYVETPTKRYAIITPCTSKLSFAMPGGGVALKTDRSPDPCRRRPTCIECVPKPGVTDLERCFEAQFLAYAAPSKHQILGPNSNTFAGTLARGCCDNFTFTPPVAFGCVPGWGDPPAPPRSAPCPSGPPVC